MPLPGKELKFKKKKERKKKKEKEICGITWNKKAQPGTGRNQDAEGTAAED